VKPVLLLNASWEPLRVIPLKRAVVLVLQEKADVLEVVDDSEPVRSASCQVARPSVIKLRYYVKVPWKAKAALNRANLTNRDAGACQRTGCHRSGNTIDHVVPRSRGGRHEWANVTLMCSKCNQEKGDRLLSELGWELKTTPSTPTRTILVGLIDPAWEPHLGLAGC
jgi:5-methylcytosine-specific restriction endonuclease McrA